MASILIEKAHGEFRAREFMGLRRFADRDELCGCRQIDRSIAYHGRGVVAREQTSRIVTLHDDTVVALLRSRQVLVRDPFAVDEHGEFAARRRVLDREDFDWTEADFRLEAFQAS